MGGFLVVTAEHQVVKERPNTPNVSDDDVARLMALGDYSHEQVTAALRMSNGNVELAAQYLMRNA
eukprot:m.104622 g.104622  ORF g.104622 m.104622 type:complete len:65 (-) comp15085_c0_seq2:1826-2020(-)